MSTKRPVMSHDPLADLEAEPPGEVVQVPEPAATTEADADDGVLHMESSLTIADVDHCYTRLSGRLERGTAVVIDGGDLETVDGAGLQLLAAFVKEVGEQQLPLRWARVSEPLQRAAGVLGLTSALRLADQGGDRP